MDLIMNDLAEELILTAELLFGPMVKEWTYMGVEFSDHPPHLAYYPEKGVVTISLSLRAQNDELQCCFQLAHEVCHLLYPTARLGMTEAPPRTIVINEGISTFFSVLMVQKLHGLEAANQVTANLSEHSPKYFSAFEKVSSLMSNDHEAVQKLRKIQPRINDVTAADFLSSGLQLSEIEIDDLVSLF